MFKEVEALTGIISASVILHVYTPQYPPSTLVRNSISLTTVKKVATVWLEIFADNAVVDQSTVTVSGTVLVTVQCIVALW